MQNFGFTMLSRFKHSEARCHLTFQVLYLDFNEVSIALFIEQPNGQGSSPSRYSLRYHDVQYKDYLSRTGKPLTPGRHALEIYTYGGDGEEKDEDPEDSAKMIEWEKEWWQKADARLNIQDKVLSNIAQEE